MWTVYGLYLPLSYPLSTRPLYGTCGAPAIRIGPVSLNSYLDSLSLCTCLSCLTQTLPRRMSLVNVRVNTATFTWSPFLSSLFPNKLFKWAFVKGERSELKRLRLKTIIQSHCRNILVQISSFSLKQTHPLTALYGGRETSKRQSHT